MTNARHCWLRRAQQSPPNRAWQQGEPPNLEPQSLENVTAVKCKAPGTMLKESIAPPRSGIAELIFNTVCEDNVTKTVKSRVNLVTISIEFYN